MIKKETLNRQALAGEQLQILREKGIISENEIAFYSGDLLVAENVITRDRRVLRNGDALVSESKRILKG